MQAQFPTLRQAISSSPSRTPRHLLLVDDHAPLREALARLLRAADPNWQVREAADGQQALQRLDEAPFDIAVVDVSMPGMNGFELTGRIRALHPSVPVLMLSMHDETSYALQALRLGARGYLMKEHAGAELANAVRAVLAGGLHLSAGLAERLLVNLGRSLGTVRHVALSARELDVLRRLSQGESAAGIAQDLGLPEAAVATSRDRIMDKLDLTTLAELVHYGLEMGLGDPSSQGAQPPPPPDDPVGVSPPLEPLSMTLSA